MNRKEKWSMYYGHQSRQYTHYKIKEQIDIAGLLALHWRVHGILVVC